MERIAIRYEYLPESFQEYLSERVFYEAKKVYREITGRETHVNNFIVFLDPSTVECLASKHVDDVYSCNYNIYVLIRYTSDYRLEMSGSTGVDEFGRKYVLLDTEVVEEMFSDYDKWVAFKESWPTHSHSFCE